MKARKRSTTEHTEQQMLHGEASFLLRVSPLLPFDLFFARVSATERFVYKNKRLGIESSPLYLTSATRPSQPQVLTPVGFAAPARAGCAFIGGANALQLLRDGGNDSAQPAGVER